MVDGKLFVVATPIGNLGDMVPRAVQCLQSVDLIAAEDTRRTGQLCHHFDIRTPMRAYHEHNELQQAQELVALIGQGQKIALVSDAGMPLVSDPGYRLVKEARRAGVEVTVIPGACALISALAGSGLPSDRFTFLGFPPAKNHAREAWFARVATATETLICYESSHRIRDSLASIKTALGDRQICVAREITKTFETWLFGTITEVCAAIDADANQAKGEFVLVIQGAEPAQSTNAEIEQYMAVLMRELPIRKAAAITAELLGERKNECYQIGLNLKS
ncbi:MAG: 16S rRNA (cytidine(1402)-2'-O)-methyltransferase [Porticoccaceae bacterium]